MKLQVVAKFLPLNFWFRLKLTLQLQSESSILLQGGDFLLVLWLLCQHFLEHWARQKCAVQQIGRPRLPLYSPSQVLGLHRSLADIQNRLVDRCNSYLCVCVRATKATSTTLVLQSKKNRPAKYSNTSLLGFWISSWENLNDETALIFQIYRFPCLYVSCNRI